MSKSNHVTRIRIISLGIFLFAVLLIGRLYFLQIVDNSIYKDKADRQYSSTAGGEFDRGTIFFTNKDGSLVSAATLESGFIVAINPAILKNPEDVYTKLNTILPLDHDIFMTKAAKKNDPYEEIATRVPTDIGTKIAGLKITGLSVYKDRWRFYPGQKEGAHILGLLGFKGDDFAGRYGLERQYNTTLERSDDTNINFFAQIFSNLKSLASASSTSEGDVVTTIEPTVESYLEETLASTSEKWSPDSIGGIIENPNTGEIYAMESYPTFDPNDPSNIKNVSTFANPLVENVYEMGSIIKPLTVSAGIDAGVITSTSTYYDPGSVTIDGKKISNFDGKNRGTVDIQTLLSQSLNVGAAHVESLLGNQLFSQYMYAFGLNQKTGIELPNEAHDLVDNLKKGDVEHATASFGQGIALTPIATIRALSTIANGGLLIEPHLVKAIDYKIGVTKTTPVPDGVRVLKKTTTTDLAKLLTYSVDHVLMNGTLKIPNYSVAAKTGTAQIPDSTTGGYSDKVLHSFIGYFPSYNPQFIILLYMVNPHGAQYGSETLTMPFMNTVNFLINYYDIPPDR